MVTVNQWVTFIINKLSVDFQHFRVFAFCQRAFSKTRKPRKISISLFLKVLRLFIWFWALSQAIHVFRIQFSKCYSKLLTRIYQWGLKEVLHAIEPQKWYLNNKFVLFKQLSSNNNCYQCFLSYLEGSLLISSVSGLRFYAIEDNRKPRNHEKF